DLTALQLAASLALAAVATVAVVWLAARIYRRSILNNGKTTKWSEALRG
ncbi:ABC transporter permease, partial [Corynebacterium tuscaniense]